MTNLSSGVYFIYAPNQNKIKIGRSVNMDARYRQLRTGFMDKGVLLLGILTENEVTLEHDLHNKFSHLRDTGEWFFLTKELKDFVVACKFKYENVIAYNSFNEINQYLNYKSLGMYKVIVFLKNAQNKILIPGALAAAGLTIALYNYGFESTHEGDQVLKYVSYLMLLIYSIYTPILARLIIAHTSVLTCILFFLIIVSTFAFECLNAFFSFDSFMVYLIRSAILSLYLVFSKNVSLAIFARLRDQRIQLNVSEEFGIPKNKDFKLSDLAAFRNAAILGLKKINEFSRFILYSSAVATIIFLNIFLLTISDSPDSPRLSVLFLIDTGSLLWFTLHILMRKGFLKIVKLKTYVIPFFSFAATM